MAMPKAMLRFSGGMARLIAPKTTGIVVPESPSPTRMPAAITKIGADPATAISPTLGTVYGIVLLLSMFCNALASLVAMLTYMEQKQAVFRKHKKLTLAAAAVLSWIGSLAGFGDLISVIFPVFGYLSVVFLVCMMVHFIQCKRREKQSA